MDIYLVGGAIRDELLGLPVEERDWVVVGATPEAMRKLGYRKVGRDFPVYLHPETQEEYALARTERKTGGGHTGFVCDSDPTVTLEQDLLRRDLTVNAIARDEGGELIDPYGGRGDLDARVLRHVSPAFAEDPLRVLRVARFSARLAHLGFVVAEDTLELMREISRSGELRSLPPERIWKELEKALGERSPAAFFEVLSRCEALDALLPELSDPDWRRLSGAAAAGASAEQSFALLLSALPAEAVEAIRGRLRPPRRFGELARLCNRRLDDFIRAGEASAEALLKLLEQCDAFRREERFEELLASWALAAPASAANRDLLRRALDTCKSVDIAQLANADIGAAEIGERLRRRRAERLRALLDERPRK